MSQAQEAFDKVWQHFVVEGNPRSAVSVVDVYGDPTEECRYRGPDGARCAAGLLIPDELYRQEMEGVSVYAAPVRGALLAVGFTAYEIDGVIVGMQRAHDSTMRTLFRPEPEDPVSPANFRATMRARLTNVAEQYGLTVPSGQA